MRETLCFCLILSFLWEQMVKAYKFMSGIFLVTHPSKQQASDCSGQPTKMDVSVLEEQYNCLKEKQKLQTHIIVFKPGGNETVPKESMVNAVLINKKMRTAKALQEGIPIREVSLELPCSENIQENSPWRIHLGIHRLAQGEPQKSLYNGQIKNEQTNSKLLSQEESMTPCEELLEGCEESNESQSKQENLITAEKTNNSNLAFTSVSSLVWTQSQTSASKLTPASCKLPYYPFPQKKTPKISEAARRLGLYVSQ
uniref:TBC1 domain-containing protein n=1 Tax=Salvator merianae TaxID=96440 RepID=A0A8D0C6N2_SALMN